MIHTKKERMRHLRFNPKCEFETAKAIDKASERFSSNDLLKMVAWVLEKRGYQKSADGVRALR